MLAWTRATDLQQRYHKVSRRPMCTKEVVERCFAVPVISAIERVYTRQGADPARTKTLIFQITCRGGRGAPHAASKPPRCLRKNQNVNGENGSADGGTFEETWSARGVALTVGVRRSVSKVGPP